MTVFKCPWCALESEYTQNLHWDSVSQEYVNEGPVLKMDADAILCRCPHCKGEFVAEPDEFVIGWGMVLRPVDRNNPLSDWYSDEFDPKDLRKQYYIQETGHQPPAKKLFSLNRRKRCKSRSR